MSQAQCKRPSPPHVQMDSFVLGTDMSGLHYGILGKCQSLTTQKALEAVIANKCRLGVEHWLKTG